MTGGGPKSPFPALIATFSVSLPLPTIPRRERDPISELSFSFAKGNERGYQDIATSEWMYAVEYRADTRLGTVIFGAVTNAYTGNVEEAVIQVARAYARMSATLLAFEGQVPPLPPPDVAPISPPLSLEAISVLNGTVRFRGFCAGLRSLDTALVDTVTVYVEPVFSSGPPPPS